MDFLYEHAASLMVPVASWGGWPVWACVSLASLSVIMLMLMLLEFVLGYARRGTPKGNMPKDTCKDQGFAVFQLRFLVVYLLVMLADWLQGTNMYTLYQSYGVDIGSLFLTGFLSSAVFGTFLGVYVDEFGRKRGCVLFCVLEVVINILEHFPHYHLLLFGRVLGGLSTSLLFSAFESWMVTEHRKQGFSEELLKSTFGLMSAGNGMVAIIAGIIAQVAADKFGDIGPFQVAIILTFIALLLILSWPENYGVQHGNIWSIISRIKESTAVMLHRPEIALLGIAQAFFEGAIFTFVFMWVPSLQTLNPFPEPVPLGLVFSCFMMCITVGGIVFGILHTYVSASILSLWLYGIAAAAMYVCVALPTFQFVFLSFLVLEVCVGTFYSTAGTMRSMYVPEALQSSLMSVFRLPLNVLVAVGTNLAKHMSMEVVFGTCVSWHITAFVCQVAMGMFDKHTDIHTHTSNHHTKQE